MRSSSVAAAALCFGVATASLHNENTANDTCIIEPKILSCSAQANAHASVSPHYSTQRTHRAILRPLPTIRPLTLPQCNQLPTQRHRRCPLLWARCQHLHLILRQVRPPRLHEQVLDQLEQHQRGILGPRVLQAHHLLLHLRRALLRPQVRRPRGGHRVLRDGHHVLPGPTQLHLARQQGHRPPATRQPTPSPTSRPR